MGPFGPKGPDGPKGPKGDAGTCSSQVSHIYFTLVSSETFYVYFWVGCLLEIIC